MSPLLGLPVALGHFPSPSTRPLSLMVEDDYMYGGTIVDRTISTKHVGCSPKVRHTAPGAADRKRKIPVRLENEENYRISPDPLETVCASFHQQSGRRGLSKYRGSQCTSMALGAVLVSKTIPVNYWRTKEMDAILRFGDRFHCELLSKLDRRLTDSRLALHEIQVGEHHRHQVPVPCVNSKWFVKGYKQTRTIFFSKSKEFYGDVLSGSVMPDKVDPEDLGDSPLEVAVTTVIEQGYDGAVITVGNISGAVVRDVNGRLRYFDSHCNNKIGRMSLDGTAVLLAFDSVQEFVRHIRKRERTTKSRYELVGVNVHVSELVETHNRCD